MSYGELDNLLKNNLDIKNLNLSKSKMRYVILDYIEYKVDKFNYNSTINYDYLLNIFNFFPYYFESNFDNKKEFYLKLKLIRDKVKTLLIQKPGNISKSANNFKFLKDLIDNLETFTLSLLYDYVDKYDGSKYEFINFLVFDVKRINLFSDALKRFPYIVNFETKECESLIDNVIKKYIDELNIYTENYELNTPDQVIYYDEILKLLLNSPKLNFNIAKQNNWINYINNLIDNVDSSSFNSLTKQKYVFFLNDLCNTIKKISNFDTEYLEYKYDIKSNFNQSIILECNRVLNKKHNELKVVSDVILTFDGISTKEIDDALSIKKLDNGNYLLGIHIADPLFYINSNSIIYDEAKRRTTSIYLSDLTVSMFPSDLSSDYASLVENKLRPATSYYYEISSCGEVVNYNFEKTLINVYKNMTYSEFNNILCNGYSDKKIFETIKLLSDVYPLLLNHYKIDPYYKKLNRTNTNITDTNIIGNTMSEKVVESAMVFNNHMVARYFSLKKLPFIYRIHTIDEETIKKLDDFSNTINSDNKTSDYLKYVEIIKNIYPSSTYSINNKGHYGLGLDSYSHITSPLRRFADIVALDCLNKMYFNSFSDSDLYKYEENIKDSINKINQKRLSIDIFSNNYEKNKYKN